MNKNPLIVGVFVLTLGAVTWLVIRSYSSLPFVIIPNEAVHTVPTTQPVVVEYTSAVTDALVIEDFFSRTAQLRELFAAWAKTDPAAAARRLAELHPKYRDYDAVGLVARALAQKDMNAAFEFAKAVDDYRLADFIQRIALEVWGQSDPHAAANYILAQFPEKQQARALDVFAKSWAERDPAASLAFAQKLNDPASKNYYLALVFDGYAARVPRGAVDAFSAMPPESVNRGNLANIISRNWAKNDPAAAAAWAATFTEDDPARGPALKQSIAAWSQTDPVKASEFIAKLAPGQSLDESIAVFVAGAVSAVPDSASEWAGSIQRPELRRAAYGSIATYYATRDIEEGQKWVQSLGALPDGWLKDIVRRMSGDGSSLPADSLFN